MKIQNVYMKMCKKLINRISKPTFSFIFLLLSSKWQSIYLNTQFYRKGTTRRERGKQIFYVIRGHQAQSQQLDTVDRHGSLLPNHENIDLSRYLKQHRYTSKHES